MGRDYPVLRILIRLDVSIHAPTWGATFAVWDLNHIIQVSIHAPTWGATLARWTKMSIG